MLILKKFLVLLLGSMTLVRCGVFIPASTPTIMPSATHTPSPSQSPTATQPPTATPTLIPKGDGKLIAFSSCGEQGSVISIVNIETLKETSLTSSTDCSSWASWSPDGTRIAYNKCKEGRFELYAMNVDGTNKILLDGDCYIPVWAPDGKCIACFSRRAGHWALYSMNPDGTGQKKLTDNTVFESIASWSPDSQAIAYNKYRGGVYIPNVFVVNAQGFTSPSQLTTEENGNYDGKWSPDGQHILFISGRTGTAQIFIMNPDGSGQKQLTSGNKPNIGAVWSPDGTQIAFVSLRDEKTLEQCRLTDICNSEIYIMNADGSSQTRLTDNPAPDLYPVWSPDGVFITFVSLRDEPHLETCGNNCNSEIYMMNADGSNPQRLTSNQRPDYNPVWQPKP